MDSKYYAKIKKELEERFIQSYKDAKKYELSPLSESKITIDFLLYKIAQLEQEIANLKTKQVVFK